MPSEIDKQKLMTLMQIYKNHLEKELGAKLEESPSKPVTKEYQDFKAEFLPKHMNWYEKLCSISEKMLKIKPDPKKAPELQEVLSITHLNITPSGAVSFSFLVPIATTLIGSLFFFLVFKSLFFVFLFLVGSIL